MVSTARYSMYPRLKELWSLGFGDSAEYLDFLFERHLKPENILVYLEDGRYPVAMLCMEPFELRGNGKNLPGVYLYAFTVHPRFRSRGIGVKLLEEYHKYTYAKGFVASILTPANQKLFSYYEQNGYQTAFYAKTVQRYFPFLSTTNRPCVLVPRSLDMLWRWRDYYFEKSGMYVRWNPSYLRYVGEELHQWDTGEVLLVTCGMEQGYLVWRKEGEDVFVSEYAMPPDSLEDVVYALHRRTGAQTIKLRLSADYPRQDSTKSLPFAMIQWYDKKQVLPEGLAAPYLSHVMD